MPARPLSAASALALLPAAFLAALPALAQDAPAPRSRAEIEQIVKDYLLREPEVIYQAIQELQARRASDEARRQQEAIAARQDQLFRAGDPILGNPDGDVTLVEFFDYRCGYCRAMVPGLRNLIDGDPKLRFVLKDLPVLGPESVTAAKAALAAEAQGELGTFHFVLMDAKDLTQAGVEALAERHGLDMARFRRDMASEEVAKRIDANLALAQDLGITGTPSFVVGKKLVPGAVDPSELARLVAETRRNEG